MFIQTKKRFTIMRTLAAALIVSICLICTPAPVKASQLEDQYNALQQQIQQQQAIFNSNNSTLTTASQKAAALQESINLNTQKLDNLNQQISSKNQDIATTQANIDTNYKRFKQELRDLYECGDNSYIMVLLESKDFTDFLSRLDVLSIVSQHDNKVLNALAQSQAQLKADQASLLSTKSAYAATVAELDKEKTQQNDIAYQASLAISAARKNESAIDRQLDLVNAQRAMRSKNPNATGADIIAEAKKCLGLPYVFDTNGPDTFDCSGLAQYVYANVAGIALIHYADSQKIGQTLVDVNGTEQIVICGHKITNQNDLQPGDLVFYHTIEDTDDGYSDDYAGHVGIYYGVDDDKTSQYYGQKSVLAANGSDVPVEIRSMSYFIDHYGCKYLWGWRYLD